MSDSQEGRNEFQQHIGVGERQVRYGRYAGTARVEPVRREDDGRIGGRYTHHWDGRVDATVFPDTAHLPRREA